MASMIYNETPSVSVIGWPGIFTEITDNSYTRSKKPNSVNGLVSLFPSRTERWLHTRQLGWAHLDVYFYTYTANFAEQIWLTPNHLPLYFWGDLRERYQGSRNNYAFYDYELDITGISVDRSGGQISPLRAALFSSRQS